MGKAKSKSEMSEVELLAAERIQSSRLSVSEQGDPLRIRKGGKKRKATQLGEPVLEREGKASEGWSKTDLAAGGGRTRSQQKFPSMDPERRSELIAEIQDQYQVEGLDREQLSELLKRRMTQLDRALTDAEHRSLHWYLFVRQRQKRGRMSASHYGDPVQGNGGDGVPITSRHIRDAECLEHVMEALPPAYVDALEMLTYMQYPEAYDSERLPPESRELGCKLIASNDKRAGNAGFAGYYRAISQAIGEAMMNWQVEKERRERQDSEREDHRRKRRALGIED